MQSWHAAVAHLDRAPCPFPFRSCAGLIAASALR